MKKPRSLFYHISIFALAQIAWLLLLGIWIYWYVSNYIIFEKVGDQVSPQLIYDVVNLVPFIGGIVLLVGISIGMSLIFRHLNVQLRLHKLYDNFIANVTHELKSPLSSIQLYLETLNSRNVPAEKQKEFYTLMLKDSNRLKYLIDSILEISALEQKNIAHNFHIYNAGDEILNLTKETILQFNLPESSITYEGNANCRFVIDKNALKIVFNNLVDNAIKYSLERPKIILKMKCNLKKVIIEFTDNGIGLASENQKKIFNKFHRIYNKDIPSVKGTGLGLFWSKEIIKKHGGTISASSEGKNKGTTFKIELPIYKSSKVRYINKLLRRSKEYEISRK
jgi:signal transduction histidine kinase